MLLAKIVGQFGVGHQVKPHQLHGSGSSILRSSILHRDKVNSFYNAQR
jgi:hypothetical protein